MIVKKIILIILIGGLIFSNVFALERIGLSNENIKIGLENNLKSILDDDLILFNNTESIYWCKRGKENIEPFIKEKEYSILSFLENFNKISLDIRKLLIKFYNKINIKEDTLTYLKNTLRKICDKKISELDKKRILKLKDKIDNYYITFNKTLTLITEIIKEYYNNKSLDLEKIKEFEKRYKTVLELKNYIENIKIMKINISKINFDTLGKNELYVFIEPKNKTVLINGKEKKANYIHLIVNKKHFDESVYNLKINTLFIVGDIDPLNLEINRVDLIFYK